MRALFIVTIFLGSLLLFLVQPMIAKMILPFFGGAPAVWNTSLVFFQAILLLGYANAHYLPRLIGLRAHLAVHLALFVGAALTLPFAVPAEYLPFASHLPITTELFGFLLFTVGLPYLAIATGAPLLQKWFARTGDPQAADPYFLYSASNVGSIVALASYPLWMESQFTLTRQAEIFKWSFVALGALVASCGFVATRGAFVQSAGVSAQKPSRATRLRWVLLAAAPTSLLLGVTNYLTTNLASIPLLWVVPLAIYLATYILAFRSKPFLDSGKWGRWAALVMAPMAMVLVLEATEPFLPLAAIHLAVFFLGAMACHSELAETRPSANHLTEFYLWISVGGVVGGAFNAIVAPSVFDSLAEYPIALVAIALLRVRQKEWDWSLRGLAMPIATVATTVAAWAISVALSMPPTPVRTALTMGLPAIFCFIAIDKAHRYALGMAAFLFLAHFLGLARSGTLVFSERSFFGVHRILEPSGQTVRQLAHGNTIHGVQNLDARYRSTPLTYYYPNGPIGEAIKAFQELKPSCEYGFVGLGVGSLAAYGRKDDSLTYFEIDPTVAKIAQDRKHFTFLADCKSHWSVELGDARLTLRMRKDREFDMLVLDAFSSDSIPMHLLTLEALKLYLSKLRPDGVLAIHISNRYLDLSPMLAAAASELGLAGYHRQDGDVAAEDEKIGKTPSHWVVMAASPETLAPIRRLATWSNLNELEGGRAWTDDRSNILETWNKD